MHGHAKRMGSVHAQEEGHAHGHAKEGLGLVELYADATRQVWLQSGAQDSGAPECDDMGAVKHRVSVKQGAKEVSDRVRVKATNPRPARVCGGGICGRSRPR